MKAVPFSKFFTLRTPTAAQSVFYRVAYDGAEPQDLEPGQRQLAAKMFGPVDTIPAAARRVVVMAKGRDVGGTRAAAERMLHLALTLDLGRLELGELPYVFFGGPKLRHGRVGLRFALAAAQRKRATVVDESADGFTIVRHDGRRVRLEAFAASRGGDNVRGVHIVGAVLTEAAFYYDEASGVQNGEQIFAAMFPRLLSGGQIIIESTVWAQVGLLYTSFTQNFGKPATALAAHCPTGLMRDDAESLAKIDAERERDPENARRELDAEFVDAESGLIARDVVKQATRKAPLELAPEKDGFYVFAYDPSEGGPRNGFTLVGLRGDIVGGRLKLRVACAREWRNVSTLEDVWSEIASGMALYGCTAAVSDSYSAAASVALAARYGLRLVIDKSTAASNFEDFSNVATMLAVGELELSPLKPLVEDLLAVKKRPTPNGFSIHLPTTRDGRHCDFASALAKAVKFARAVPEIQRKQGRLRGSSIQGLGPITPVRQLLAQGFSF